MAAPCAYQPVRPYTCGVGAAVVGDRGEADRLGRVGRPEVGRDDLVGAGLEPRRADVAPVDELVVHDVGVAEHGQDLVEDGLGVAPGAARVEAGDVSRAGRVRRVVGGVGQRRRPVGVADGGRVVASSSRSGRPDGTARRPWPSPRPGSTGTWPGRWRDRSRWRWLPLKVRSGHRQRGAAGVGEGEGSWRPGRPRHGSWSRRVVASVRPRVDVSAEVTERLGLPLVTGPLSRSRSWCWTRRWGTGRAGRRTRSPVWSASTRVPPPSG